MSQQELEGHRSKICFEVEVILDGYWKDRPSEAVKAAILADWADTLEDWPHDWVLHGLRKWRDQFPSKKPNPSHIKNMLIEARRGQTDPHLDFYANMVNSDRFLPDSMISAETAQKLLDGGYVTPERAKSRGIL